MAFFDPESPLFLLETESFMQKRESSVKQTAWNLMVDKQRKLQLEALIRDPNYPDSSVLQAVAKAIIKK